MELRHTIQLIRVLDAEIEEIEADIQAIMEQMSSPITTIPGIGYRMGAMILAEAGDYNVAISHAAKKLVRLIYALEKSREPYRLVA